jgi:tetratricopeptide (TPR) repeat protein
MRNKILIATLFLFLFQNVNAQTYLDSLMTKFAHSVADTNKIKLLFKIEKAFINANKPDSAMYYLSLNEKLINELKAIQYEYDFVYENIAVYHALADYEKALQYTFKSIEVADRNKNVFQKADSYRALFNIYYNLGEVENAIKYALYSIHFSDSINYTENQVINYGNLTRLYNDLEQYEKAVEYGEKGIESGRKEQNNKGLLVCLNNTALAYRNMNKNEKAETLWKEQLEIATQENFPRSASKALINLCMLYAHTTQKELLNKYTMELTHFVMTNADVRLSPTDKVFQYIINAYNFIFQNSLEAAENELDKGIEIATENEIMFHLSDLYLLKTKLKYAENNYPEAEKFNRNYDSIQLILTGEEFAEYSLDLEKKYETQKKEQTDCLTN